MLTSKLGDPQNKPLYMKIAKHEEQELVMSAFSYALTSNVAPAARPKIFMWRLSELKKNEIEPIIVSLNLTKVIMIYGEGKEISYEKDLPKIPFITISPLIRSDYPYIVAAFNKISDKYGEILRFEQNSFTYRKAQKYDVDLLIKDSLVFRIKNSLYGFWKIFKKNYNHTVNYSLKFSVPLEICEDIEEFGDCKIWVEGKLSVSAPVLTKKIKQYRIP